ncbi:MAG: hypothetical protein QOD24_3066, partial [Solirubrobacteraceae bacterium]|nr:hypothetical protein [Solirubrobacteraceae bacterium]
GSRASVCQCRAACSPTNVAIESGGAAHELFLADKRVADQITVSLHVAERHQRRQQRLGAERIKPQPNGQLGRCRRLLVQRVEHSEQHRRRQRARHDKTGERIEVGIREAALRHARRLRARTTAGAASGQGGGESVAAGQVEFAVGAVQMHLDGLG